MPEDNMSMAEESELFPDPEPDYTDDLPDPEPDYTDDQQFAVCDALNILIWKIPAGEYRPTKKLADYIASELNQATSYKMNIRWNDITEIFEVNP